MVLNRRLASALMAVYVAVALPLTLFALPVSPPPPNLVPFATIAWLLTENSPGFALVQVAGNLLLLAPLALLAPSALPWLRRWWRVALLAAALSAAIELAQLVIPGRHADVDDVILNVSGVLLAHAARLVSSA